MHIQYEKDTFVTLRCESETSDTASTDEERTWGGLGKYEYSLKGLPHALLHYPEMIVNAGHHGAYCTAAAEMSHIRFNKRAATFTQTDSSQNRSEENMLRYNLRQQLYSAVMTLDKDVVDENRTRSADEEPEQAFITRLRLEGWQDETGVTVHWKNKFVGPTVRLTRNELLHLLGNKLRITGTDARVTQFHDDVLLKMRSLTWEFYGVLTTPSRKLVASAPGNLRRDFVRLKDDVVGRGTCLSAQLITFIYLSGFGKDGGVPLVDGEDSVSYALVRWLTPHPEALVRDTMQRPICPPPMDINHALWKFATENRPLLTPSIVNRHITSYPGGTMDDKVRHMHSEERAWFGLVEIDCIEEILNCTYVNGDLETILQTITLPFQ